MFLQEPNQGHFIVQVSFENIAYMNFRCFELFFLFPGQSMPSLFGLGFFFPLCRFVKAQFVRCWFWYKFKLAHSERSLGMEL